jgi:hypothetical protein
MLSSLSLIPFELFDLENSTSAARRYLPCANSADTRNPPDADTSISLCSYFRKERAKVAFRSCVQ